MIDKNGTLHIDLTGETDLRAFKDAVGAMIEHCGVNGHREAGIALDEAEMAITDTLEDITDRME